MRYLSGILTTIILLCSSLSAATYSGKAIDDNGRPIEGVNIQSDLDAVNGVTDADGKFSLETGSSTPSYLSFSHVSYQPKMIKLKNERSKENFIVVMTPEVYPGQNIRVTAMRAERGVTPVPFADFTQDEVNRDYTLSDFPVLLETTPNMQAVSYTGGIVGASDYKIRGFGYKQVGVYINGIPLNDPEDRFTYFYDLPDFAAEVADIQVQRGVGNSLYGDATFGGSINIASEGLGRNRQITFSTGYGKYTSNNDFVSEMRKTALEYSSGLIDGRWSLAARYSKMYSGGYREHSWYDGWAYFLSLSRLDENMTTTVNVYGGPMQAALAFDGVDRATLATDRRYNPVSYPNEKDDFNQPHYELHNTIKLNDRLTLKNSLYYIHGEGYYEQLKEDRGISSYNISPEDLIDTNQSTIDLVTQKWVSKDQYGWNPRLDIEHANGSLALGGAFYYFNSDHWGQIEYAENVNADAIGPGHRFYTYFGTKYSASVYALDYYSLTERLRLMGNLQFRYLRYKFDSRKTGQLPSYNYDVNWLFFSPRTGLTYELNDNADLYFSFGVASREPADVTIYDAEEIGAVPNLEVRNIIVDSNDDSTFVFGDPTINPERVYNFELGTNLTGTNYRAGVNLFWMEFRNEIVPEGGIDDNGRPNVGNAKRSVHAGVELDGAVKVLERLNLSGNASFNFNRLRDYTIYPDYDYDGIADDTLDYSDNVIGGFPEYLGNMIFDYKTGRYRFTYRFRVVGKQYIDNGQTERLAIDPYTVSSLSATVSLGTMDGLGMLSLSGTVNNLFNQEYETSGYSYWWGPDLVGEYYVGAERSFYMQLKWEMQ